MKPADDNEPVKKTPLIEQWWGGFGALLILATIVMYCLLARADGADCRIAWNANPEPAVRYRIYLGATLLAETLSTQAVVTLPDGPCTIAVTANNEGGQSQPTLMKLCFVSYQDSIDLRAWRNAKGHHFEYLPGPRFHRTKIEIPP